MIIIVHLIDMFTSKLLLFFTIIKYKIYTQKTIRKIILLINENSSINKKEREIDTNGPMVIYCWTKCVLVQGQNTGRVLGVTSTTSYHPSPFGGH